MSTITPDDTELALRWARQLDIRLQAHGLAGYDPSDVRGHPIPRAAQAHWLPRYINNLTLTFFPVTARRVLGIKPAYNPKSLAMVAIARLRLYEMLKEAPDLAGARQCLEWLHENARTDGPGLAWGFPYEDSGRGVYRPAGIPVAVVSALAGEAFSLAWKLTGDAQYMEAARLVGEYFIEGLNRIDGGDGTFCYSYSSVDESPVHSSNLRVAAHLYRLHAMTREREWLEKAAPALEYSLRRQRADGSWPYGEYVPAAGVEKGMFEMINHHYTGATLRALYEINQILPSSQVQKAIKEGYEFYSRRLFSPAGIPRVTTTTTWPVNVHACAEAILCPATLNAMVPGAARTSVDTMRWMRAHMCEKTTGLPYYGKYPILPSRIIYPKWGTELIYHALSEFLYATKTEAITA
jgi:hypothetical protein